MFSKLKGQVNSTRKPNSFNPVLIRFFIFQVCIKEPGSINGQMFIVEDCEDCDVYLCDFMATVPYPRMSVCASSESLSSDTKTCWYC